MKATVDPESDEVFNSAVWINGVPSGNPQTDAEWEIVKNHALTLAEAGNLLMMPGRAKDQVGWMFRADDLVKAGLAAAKAADTKSMENMFQAGGHLALVCDGCHEQYPPAVIETPAPSH